jgi:hypothetical protein
MKHMFAAFMTIALMNTTAWAHEAPPVDCFAKCKEVHCAKEVICKNLKDCPPPAACNCVCDPKLLPTPPVIIPGPLEVRTATVTREIPSSIPPSGKWALLPGLMWIDGWETDISYYEQRYDDPEDPALRLTMDDMVLASLDLEFVGPSGWGFQIGPFVAIDKPDLDVVWTDRPYLDVSKLQIGDPDRPWGVAARVRIPLGKR